MIRGLAVAVILAAALCGQNVQFEVVEWPNVLDRGAQVIPGDFNGDGNTDIVQFTKTHVITRLANGDGTWGDPIATPTPVWMSPLAAADFDGDGILDIAADSTVNDPTLSLYVGDGKGGFTLAGSTFLKKQVYTAVFGSYVNDAAAADLNGDGQIDLVLQPIDDDIFSAPGPVLVLLNSGGQFRVLSPLMTVEYARLRITDFDSDGIADLLIRPDRDRVMIRLGNGDGTFRDGPEPPLSWSEQVSLASIDVADCNLDGIPDLAITWPGGAARVLTGKGDATFGVWRSSQIPGPYLNGIVDLDGNNVPDWLVADPINGRFFLLQGNYDGSFRDPVELHPGIPRGKLFSADWNGDGRQDIAIFRSNGAGAAALLNTTPARLAPTPVISAAGLPAGGVAPNMLVSIYGLFLGDPARPDRTRVRINGADTKLIFVSPGQLNLQASASLGAAGRPGRIEIATPTGVLETEILIVDYAPAILYEPQGNGRALVLHVDGTLVTPDSPARIGEKVIILCTGLGLAKDTPDVRFGGESAPGRVVPTPVPYPLQAVEAAIPEGAATLNPVRIELSIGGVISNSALLSIRSN